MGEFSALIEILKIQMNDLSVESGPPSECDLIQLKYDGFFTALRIKCGIMYAITSGGDVRFSMNVGDIPDATLVAEWIYGTNWSKKPEQAYIYDKFIVHNLVRYEGLDLGLRPYYLNYNLSKKYLEDYLSDFERFIPIESYPVQTWIYLWNKKILEEGYEGIIFKNSRQPLTRYNLFRMKRTVTMDYVIMGFNEGKNRLTGTLGSIEGGLFVNGKLRKICTVGGGFDDSLRDEIWNNRDKYVGKVMEVSGKTLFDTGALRHPAFLRFRDDKSSYQCTPPNILQER